MQVVVYALCAILAVCIHEVSHGYVANFFGDHTARDAGRLTLNPLAHIDPVGTVLIPIVLAISGLPIFGYAKPVPVNVSRLRRPRNQSVLVALAGPGVNIALAVASIAVCRITGVHGSGVELNGGSATIEIAYVAAVFGLVNVTLAAFNLLPIPPLDGSAVVERLVPQRFIGAYFELRRRALPVFMVLWLLNATVFHWGGGALNGLYNLFLKVAFPS
jgi:Zn-dependent protease